MNDKEIEQKIESLLKSYIEDKDKHPFTALPNLLKEAIAFSQSHMKRRAIALIKDHFSDHIGDAGTVIDELLSDLKEL